MVTEFEIRREFTRIDASEHAPLRKARLMLRLARRVRVGAARLAHLSYGLMQDCMGEQASRMEEASRRLCELHDDIRARAAEVLYGPPVLGFGYAPRNDTHPGWSVYADQPTTVN